jgi:nucleoside-diphosphate-sugar epimerase
MVFGERDKDVFQMFQWIKFGLHLIPTPRGSCYSLIHAADLSKGLIRAAQEGERIDGATTHDPSGVGLYYLAYDQHPSYDELGKIIASSLGRSTVRLIRVPPPLTWVIATIYEIGARIRRKPSIVNFDKARDGFAGSWACTGDKAKEQLGFKPEFTLEQRMHQTAQWYLDNGWL